MSDPSIVLDALIHQIKKTKLFICSRYKYPNLLKKHTNTTQTLKHPTVHPSQHTAATQHQYAGGF